VFTACAIGALCGPHLASARADDPAPDAAPATKVDDVKLVTISEGLRIDAPKGIVEFDGRISPMILTGAHGRGHFLLEQFVCAAGTKDHESLIVTAVKPSAIHAALLAAGGEPGAPVTWVLKGDTPTPVPPHGTALTVEFYVENDTAIDPRTWVIDAETKAQLTGGGWVFAGSTQKTARGTPFYEADAAGTLVGLAGFGSETIAWSEPISDQEDAGELKWVANREVIPAGDTPVRVRVTVVK
jgi:hypothetical protein